MNTRNSNLIDNTTGKYDNTYLQESGQSRGSIHATQMGKRVTVVFSSGGKVHAGHLGSTVAACGGWLKYNAVRMRPASGGQYKVSCLKCLDQGSYEYTSDLTDDEHAEWLGAIADEKATGDGYLADNMIEKGTRVSWGNPVTPEIQSGEVRFSRLNYNDYTDTFSVSVVIDIDNHGGTTSKLTDDVTVTQ